MRPYDLPAVIDVEADGDVRIVRLNRPEQLNATNHELHRGLAELLDEALACAHRIAKLPKQAGQKEIRFAHLLAGEPSFEAGSAATASPGPSSSRIIQLEIDLQQLRAEFQELKGRFEQLEAQLK